MPRTKPSRSRWAARRRHLAPGTILLPLLLSTFAAPGTPGLAPGDLQIHEVVSLNHAGLRDESGNRSDWIELHNPGASPVALAGWSLSDDSGSPRKWTFASGVVGPGEFLVVHASGENRQPVPGSPTPPDQIPGLAVWLQADAVRLSDPLQVRRTASGDFLRLWADSSGTGRHARQDTQALQPRYVTQPVPSVEFDGQDDLLRLAGAPAFDSFTLVAVFRPTRRHEVDSAGFTGVGGTSGQAWLFGAGHGGDAGAGAGISVGTNGVSLYEHGSSYMPAVATYEGRLPGPWSLVTATYDNRSPRLSVDGNDLPPVGTSPRLRVTAPTEIGSGSYGAFAGGIAEILVYARSLTDDERRNLDAHLARRHGVSLASTFHTNFRIDADGERLVLTRPDGSRADDVRVPTLPRDVSWGRLGGQPDSWRYLETPSPGQPNPTQGARAFLASPSFSQPPGFYADTVQIGLTSPDPGAEIRYTLDGSLPEANSPLFADSIRITNRSNIPNRLSAIATAPGWSPPSGRVFKGTVVRARAFRADALPSEPVTASYFVHPRGRARYSLPVVSLVSDERNFFDPEIGIYVVGNAQGGNYAQSGDAWERPVHVELFEPDGSRPIAQESGVRIHGNTSFGFPVKALRLHPLNQRGTGPFRHRIFPDLPIDSFDRLLLRPSGHDHYLTMMRDGLMQGLMHETGIDVQGYRPAILFLNGEYWGIHNLQEAFEKRYFESHHPEVDADAIDYLEGYAPGAFAYEGDAQHYHALVRHLESHATTDPDVAAWVASQMEVENFRDYKLAEIFYYRWDIGNHRLWRPRAPNGRLRWILFDCDVGFGGFWSEPNPWTFDMLRAVLEPSGSLHGHNNPTTVFLLSRLLENESFRVDFVNRAADLMNTTLEPGRMLAFIDRMAAEIAPEIVDHVARWRSPANLSEWSRNVEALRTFARERPTYNRRHFASRFGLPGTAELTLNPPRASVGTVGLNSLGRIDTTHGTWKGIYFRDLPITISATPSPGYRFAGWAELPGVTTATLTLRLRGDSTLTPIFEVATPPRWTRVQRNPDGTLRTEFEAESSAEFRLESSSDLVTWTVEPGGVLRTDAGGAGTATVPMRTTFRFLRLSKIATGATSANR